MDSRVLALLCQAREAVEDEVQTGLDHALLFAVEAAVNLAQACEAQGDRLCADRMREAYSCVRAAATAARFAIVAAEDDRRSSRPAVDVRARPDAGG
jgi:hypothetical protein